MTIIYFILILGVVILVHEFGHFLFAKLCGIYVYEFSIGMGPRLLHKKIGETEYCLRLIPIGGFVQLAGEEVEDDDKVPKDRKLQAKKPWQRFVTMFFGAGFNFIFAVILLFFIGLIWGAPKMDPVISNVEANYPASEAGIQAGDRIIKINKKKVSTMDDVSIYLTLANPEKATEIVVKKASGNTVTYQVKPKKETVDEQEVYRYGIGLVTEKEHGFLAAINYMGRKTVSLFKQMFITVKGLFTGGVKVNQLSGPVGIYTIVGEQTKAGLASALYLIAYLSINVGFINLLPLPAFDGGRILFLAIEKIKGSPVKPETENMVHTIGFFLLMALMVYITFNDILRLF